MGRLAGQVYLGGSAVITEQNQVFAAKVGAVSELRGRCSAAFALADGLCLVGEVHVHAVVEDVERTLPERLVALALAVANDATLDLVNLFEAALDHDRAQDLAANTAGAVGDDRLVFDVVVFARLDLGDEVVAGLHVGNDRVFELADFGFVGIASVEEHNVVAALDAKDNVYPRKPRVEAKIDNPVALIAALGVAMTKEEETMPTSPWDDPEFSLSGAN